MSYDAGGYIFVPKRPGESFVNLVRAALQHAGDVRRERVSLMDPIAADTRTDAFQVLEATRHGVIDVQFAGFPISLSFSPFNDSQYDIVQFTLPESSLYDLYSSSDERRDPDAVLLLAWRWLAFCDALHADAAFFGKYWSINTPEIAAKQLTYINEHRVSDLLDWNAWRLYLGPNLAPMLDRDKLRYYRLQTRSSGANVLLNGDFNPVVGDFDVADQADFIIARLQEHQDVSGITPLLAIIAAERQGRIARLFQENEALQTLPGLHQEKMRQISSGLAESRAVIDHVRYLWASAYRRPELVAINQSFSYHDAAGTTTTLTIPIIYNGGRTWMMYVADEAVRDDYDALLLGAQAMIEAARQNPFQGRPPEVVVYCWDEISPRMREQIRAIGASLEVAPMPIPLLEEA